MARPYHKETKNIIKQLGASSSLDSGRILQDNDAKKELPNFTRYNYRGVSTEIKVTGKKSYVLNIETWKKTVKEAQTDNYMPTMVIELANNKLVILSLDDFLAMCDEIKSNENKIGQK